MAQDASVVIQYLAGNRQNMASNKWHPAALQPCLTCKKWIPLEMKLHFLGSGYECDKCYHRRINRIVEPIKKMEQEEKGRFCSECGQADYSYLHEVKTWTYTLIPVTMYFTADRKLICQRCVTDVRLRHWWTEEMAKPREPHPTYYTKHDPFSKVCTCDFCNDPNNRTRRTKTNRDFPNRKRIT